MKEFPWAESAKPENAPYFRNRYMLICGDYHGATAHKQSGLQVYGPYMSIDDACRDVNAQIEYGFICGVNIGVYRYTNPGSWPYMRVAIRYWDREKDRYLSWDYGTADVSTDWEPIFTGDAHKLFYYRHTDCLNFRHRILWYLLGCSPVTRKHWKRFFDNLNDRIKPEGYEEDWQTPDTLGLCHLAANMFDGDCSSDPEHPEAFTPYVLFKENAYRQYMEDAINHYISEQENSTMSYVYLSDTKRKKKSGDMKRPERAFQEEAFS